MLNEELFSFMPLQIYCNLTVKRYQDLNKNVINQNALDLPYSNRIWPTAMAGKADIVSSVSDIACQIGGQNSGNTGQILLVYCIAKMG